MKKKITRKEKSQNRIKRTIRIRQCRKRVEDKIRAKIKGNKQKTGTHMADINTALSTITSNIISLKRDYQSGSKTKIQLYVLKKKPTLNINTKINNKWIFKNIPC